jgi:hypothetical protein
MQTQIFKTNQLAELKSECTNFKTEYSKQKSFNFMPPKSYSGISLSASKYAINLKRDTVKKVFRNINAFKQDLLRVTPDLEKKYGSNK